MSRKLMTIIAFDLLISIIVKEAFAESNLKYLKCYSCVFDADFSPGEFPLSDDLELHKESCKSEFCITNNVATHPEDVDIDSGISCFYGLAFNSKGVTVAAWRGAKNVSSPTIVSLDAMKGDTAFTYRECYYDLCNNVNSGSSGLVKSAFVLVSALLGVVKARKFLS